MDMMSYKALRMLGFILGVTMGLKKIETLKTLCLLCTKSLGEELSILSIYFLVHSQAIESVQRRFLKYIGFCLGISAVKFDYEYCWRLGYINSPIVDP
jgi:hypothetical protein